MSPSFSPYVEVAAMIGLFMLRLGVPLAITVLVTWGLKRLDARWQADAEAKRAVLAVDAGRLQPARMKAPIAAQTACWEAHACSSATCAGCAAYASPNLPCWMARLRSTGRLPGKCYGCAFFRTRPRLEAVVA